LVETIRLHTSLKGESEARERAVHWLERVRIDSPRLRFDNFPYGMSGGMCQRAMIAMALSAEPSLLIADEPTTGLDATIQSRIVPERGDDTPEKLPAGDRRRGARYHRGAARVPLLRSLQPRHRGDPRKLRRSRAPARRGRTRSQGALLAVPCGGQGMSQTILEVTDLRKDYSQRRGLFSMLTGQGRVIPAVDCVSFY